MNSLSPVSKLNTRIRRAARAVFADLLAVLALGALFVTLWMGQ